MAEVNCEFLIDLKKGKERIGKCKLTQSLCPYMRFCTATKKIVNTYIYTIQGCDVERNKEIYFKEDNKNV